MENRTESEPLPSAPRAETRIHREPLEQTSKEKAMDGQTKKEERERNSQAVAKLPRTTKKASKKMAKSGKQSNGTVLDVLKEKRADYTVTKVEGRRLIDNNDEVATKLRGLDLDSVYAACAKETGTPEKELRERYQHLNVGMQRMNLGNRMRGGKKEPKVAKPKAEKKAATPKTKKVKAPAEASA
jgi:hypothetical protein